MGYHTILFIKVLINLIGHLQNRRKSTSPMAGLVPLKGAYSKHLRLLRAEQILRCSYPKIEQFNYKCSEIDGGGAALTMPLVGNSVQLSSDFFDHGEAWSVSTVVHEATHKCGTTDLDYFEHDDVPKDYGIVPWELIADTYSYWIEEGFCVPGDDCRSK